MKRFLIIAPIVFILSFFIGLILSSEAVMSQVKSSWTIETLKEHYDQRFVALQTAVDKAEAFSKEKFENTNEWRATLENLGRTYMPRLEQESRDKAQDAQIKENAEAIKKMENVKQGGNIVWAYLISAISLIAAIISISINIQKKRT